MYIWLPSDGFSESEDDFPVVDFTTKSESDDRGKPQSNRSSEWEGSTAIQEESTAIAGTSSTYA